MLLWLTMSGRPPSSTSHPVIRHSLTIWDCLKFKFKLTKTCSPMIPLFGNPDFDPGRPLNSFQVWRTAGITRVGDLFPMSGLTPFPELQKERNLPPAEIFRYLQIKH
ncbi:hypothetical protein FKM82_018710 [Ascaphus truei]